jgi:hypothetical protein
MSEEVKKNGLSTEVIERFLNGHDNMERIVNIEYDSQDDFVEVYYRDTMDRKCKHEFPFYPFCWATRDACLRLCHGDRDKLKYLMRKYAIGVKKLSNTNTEGKEVKVFEKGYMFMFYALKPISYRDFTTFFRMASNPLYSSKKKKDGTETYEDKEKRNQYMTVTPVEQFMIQSGKRFFKGYDDYDQLLRMTFDLETEGLDINHDRIIQLSVRFNRPFNGHPNGFERIFSLQGETEQEKNECEVNILRVFCLIISKYQPDIVCGHNIENFDFPMMMGAAKRLGTSFEEISAPFFGGKPIRKEDRETILKLGGEIETFHKTIIPHTIVTDSLQAVRRAQATDSNMMRADLKYACKYAGLVKPNRVYTPGDKISDIWKDTEHQYAFNDTDGDWYIYDKDCECEPFKDRGQFNSDDEYAEYIHGLKGKDGDKPFKMRTRNYLMDGYEIVTGRYIIERYLLDDVWEGDKVEASFDLSDFLICKMIPVPYKKCTTMGTAGQWKALMQAWSYENNLAIPPLVDTDSFTGGLSRLLVTGYVKDIVKLDYNSLYPSIILSMNIYDETDLMGAMNSFLEYFLSTREVYKGEKKKANKLLDKLNADLKDNPNDNSLLQQREKALADFQKYDNAQLTRKKFCNSFFGSYGANTGGMFPWKSVKCAEQTTCTGRQMLRLLISHFKKLGYTPLVGDSFTGDTPLFVKYKENKRTPELSGLIDIKPISEIINENNIEKDALGREYDRSEKPYYVLCRSGWHEVNYVYRHKTDKDICRVVDGSKSLIDVTEDHSLYNSNGEKITPKEINDYTELEYLNKNFKIEGLSFDMSKASAEHDARWLAEGWINRVPWQYLNTSLDIMRDFYFTFMKYYRDDVKYSKTCLAGLMYMKSKIGFLFKNI